MTINLSVNLNAIAMLRNRRNLPWPNLLHFANISLKAGAHGLTVHPRPDERHIRFADVIEIRAFLDKYFPDAPFNIEGYPSKKFLDLAKNNANQITLVPDSPEQNTSDHGWDFIKQASFLEKIISDLKKNNVIISLFANPDKNGLNIAKSIGADRVEFYTGPYASYWNDPNKEMIELLKLKEAAYYAKDLGLLINAGHDLTLNNLPLLVNHIPFIKEVSIGHALSATALEFGMEHTVQLFKQILNSHQSKET